MNNWIRAGGFLFGVVLCSCGGGGTGAIACVPGIQQACACPGGETGAQACNAAGTGFGECVGCPDLPGVDAATRDLWASISDLAQADASSPDLSAAVPDMGHDDAAVLRDLAQRVDGSNVSDGSAADPDLAVAPIVTTPHAIDVATIGDPLSTAGTEVSLSGLVVLAPPSGFAAKVVVSGDGCRYEVWAQDPACTTPPCGILLETPAILNPNGAGAFCPYADALTDASNFLQTTRSGDVVSVQGAVDRFPATGASFDGGVTATVIAHEVVLDQLTTTVSAGALPAATVITDTSPSLFVSYTGTGWAKYEGMYVQLVPPSGLATFTSTLNTSSSFNDTCTGVTGKTDGSFTLAPGGAYFTDTYAGFYIDRDAGEATNCWPTDGTTFSSVSGIVSAGFGGSILPTTTADFHD